MRGEERKRRGRREGEGEEGGEFDCCSHVVSGHLHLPPLAPLDHLVRHLTVVRERLHTESLKVHLFSFLFFSFLFSLVFLPSWYFIFFCIFFFLFTDEYF